MSLGFLVVLEEVLIPDIRYQTHSPEMLQDKESFPLKASIVFLKWVSRRTGLIYKIQILRNPFLVKVQFANKSARTLSFDILDTCLFINIELVI